MKIGLVLCGAVLGAAGAFVFRPIPVQAQVQNNYIRVDQAGIGGTTIVGTSRTVVGFSCTSAGGEPFCFVATR